MADINWYDIPDDEIIETPFERLAGLTEMFPSFLRNGVSSLVDATKWTASTGFWLTRNAVWITATSSLILFLPYIIEKERSDLEKSQVAQQRQLLLGPSAAIANAKPAH